MKKKGFIIAGGILIVAVIVAVICFIISGDKGNTSTSTVELDGTWCVFQYAENKTVNEFLVFNNSSVSDYRDGNEDPFVTSSYTYENGKLVMPDISKEFTVRVVSDNNIVLVEPDTREWKMIKVSNGDRDFKDVTASDLLGEYDVVMVAGEKRSNEVMTFTDSNLIDTRDGKEYISCNYEIFPGHLLKAIDISKEFYIYKNGNTLMLIEKDEGYVWELLAK